MNILKIKRLEIDDYKKIGINFSSSAKKHNMTVQTCAEDFNLVEFGFIKSECLTRELAEKLTGKKHFKKWNARNNKNCKCIEMVDIGVYNTCKHFCKYCYANFDEIKVEENIKKHNKNSSLLVGNIEENDVIKVRV